MRDGTRTAAEAAADSDFDSHKRMNKPRTARRAAGRRPNGTGNIRQLKGRGDYWRADRIIKGDYYSATGTTPEEAWQKLQDKIAQEGRRRPGTESPDKISVAEYVRAWLERRRLEIGQ